MLEYGEFRNSWELVRGKGGHGSGACRQGQYDSQKMGRNRQEMKSSLRAYLIRKFFL